MTHIEAQNILFHILKDLGIAPNTMLDKNDILFVEFQNENKDKEYRIFMGETYLSMGRIRRKQRCSHAQIFDYQ